MRCPSDTARYMFCAGVTRPSHVIIKEQRLNNLRRKLIDKSLKIPSQAFFQQAHANSQKVADQLGGLLQLKRGV